MRLNLAQRPESPLLKLNQARPICRGTLWVYCQWNSVFLLSLDLPIKYVLDQFLTNFLRVLSVPSHKHKLQRTHNILRQWHLKCFTFAQKASLRRHKQPRHKHISGMKVILHKNTGSIVSLPVGGAEEARVVNIDSLLLTPDSSQSQRAVSRDCADFADHFHLPQGECVRVISEAHEPAANAPKEEA